MSGSARGGDVPRRVWIFNLDAERELERFRVDSREGRPAGRPARYRASDELRAIERREGPRAAARLLGPRDLAWVDGTLRDAAGRPADADLARGALGRAWSPTPSARRTLERLGATLPVAPPTEALVAVNARPFTAALTSGLDPQTVLVKHVAASLDAALERLAGPSPLGWLARRPFGAAGRGRRRLHAGRPTPDELAWLTASLRLGPLVIEPFVAVVAETTRCAWLAPDGRLSIAAPGLQKTDPQGAWLSTVDAEARAIAREDDARLLAALEHAGAALHAAGYFGPYGIDAFWHRPLDGGPGRALQPLSEINARFTMDWIRGLGP